MIIDSFLFFDEFDLLAARVKYLSPVVDYFVAVESAHSFSGNQKKLQLADYIAKHLPDYSSRIYIAVNQSYILSSALAHDEDIKTLAFPFHTSIAEIIRVARSNISDIDAWLNDTYQREFISIPLSQLGLKANDLVILSDIDEIPSHHFIDATKNALKSNLLVYAYMNQHVYCPTYEMIDEWIGSVAFRYDTLNQFSLNEARFLPKRNPNHNLNIKFVKDGGWHFTSFGSVVKIKRKIRSWGHRELDNFLNSMLLSYRLSRGFDVLGRRVVIKPSSGYQTIPNIILSSFRDYYKGPFIEPNVIDFMFNNILSYVNSTYVRLRNLLKFVLSIHFFRSR